MIPSPTGSMIEEAEVFLAHNPDVEAIDLVLHDANGIARGKIIRRHELLGLYRAGRHLPISILGLDICGEDVGETGLIWDQGDADLRAWPIAGSLKRIYGTNPVRAEVLLAMYTLEGAPMGSDPRHALARQVEGLAGMGLKASAAFELEFFLLAEGRDRAGRIQPAGALVGGRQAMTDVYSVDALQGMLPLFDGIYQAAEMAGIKAETMISEYAPGQYELTLHYREDILAAADDLLRLKRIVRAQARAQGLVACFMAKPFEAYAGSGMHLHVSLQDRAGVNVFTEFEEGAWKPELLHAMGGLLQVMGESMLVFAPHANSWRRFAAQSYAPVAPTWGVNNRSVAVRVPAGDKAARRFEHRPAGVDANPYLVGAMVLAGVRKGLVEGLDPGPEVTGNGYGQDLGQGIPKDWRSAIELAERSQFVRDALGAEMHRTLCAIKAAEYARVVRTVSELDYELYLHRV